jgi:hypothetical protein
VWPRGNGISKAAMHGFANASGGSIFVTQRKELPVNHLTSLAAVGAMALFSSVALGAEPNAGTAQPIDPTLAGVAGAILDKVAGSLAPGMSREGAPMAAMFQPGQGQTMEQVIPLQTGRCYTVVAAGPTVQAWDLQLLFVAPPMPIVAVLAHETGNGTTASLGGNGNCFKWNLPPAQARIVVKVTQGGGIAVAQLYGK